jgi:hypothetical protein
MRALCERKPYDGIRISLPEFKCVPQLVLLYDLAGRVPPLLQAFDSASDRPDNTLLDSLSTLQEQFEIWLNTAPVIERQNGNIPSDLEDSVQSDRARASLWYLTRESLCRICLLLVAECVDALLNHKSMVGHLDRTAETRALQLRCNIESLAHVVESPVSVARAVNAPLHFLTRYYAQAGDTSGLEWCAQFKGDIHKSVPWLRWDVLLPWGLLTVHETPMFNG